MEWRVYSRTGRVYGAEIKEPSVVRTNQGPIEAEAGDFVIVDEDVTQVRHIPAGYFQRIFGHVERPIPLKALTELSNIAVSRVAPISSDRLGLQCGRCGHNLTTREFEGIPTCTACELSIRAEREERRECRNDGTLMRKEVLADVIVDRCPECGGVWLDGGELEELSASIHRYSLLRARPE